MKCRNAKGAAKAKKLSDGGGLHLFVTPGGAKYWRMAYRWHGKQRTLAIGVYPIVSLAATRQARDEAKRHLASGADPSTVKKNTSAPQACEVLGWVQRRSDKGRVSWALTEFGKLFKGPIHLEDGGDLTIVDEIRQRIVASFATSIDPKDSSAEVRRIFEILREEGGLCCIGDDAGKVLFVWTAKGLFTDRNERELSTPMKRVFRALQTRGLMEREVTNSGEWVWRTTCVESAVRIRSTTEPAICVLLNLELGRIATNVILREVRNWL